MGEAAFNLPWLCPSAASLVALARDHAATVWPSVRADPGCVLLLVRHAFPTAALLDNTLIPTALQSGEALQAAWIQLHKQTNTSEPNGFVDWNKPSVQSIYDAALQYARLAHRLAAESKVVDPELAWVGGLLAPLGWLAEAAAGSSLVMHGPSKNGNRQSGCAPQHHVDGFAIARRLNERWQLPSWLACITGHLLLPLEVVRPLGADDDLFQIVQLAVSFVDQKAGGLGLLNGDVEKQANQCGMRIKQIQQWQNESASDGGEITWQSPASAALLPDLLQVAVENRRLSQIPRNERFHQQIDALHRALQNADRVHSQNLHQQKMTAMAEFAAGAAHEINNPLAVISGQAQYLMAREEDSDRRNVLQKIIGQTQRVHHILTDVLQFARPAEPQKQPIDVGGLLHRVVAPLRKFADERKVQLTCTEPPALITLHADPAQIGKVLTCLLQNAVEAAPENGWAGVRVELPQADQIHFLVEDNGKGPPGADKSALFDPFYSGRQAGRGKGLGLPIAWQLARLHDGDVYFDENAGGSTCFVLSLPLPPVNEPANRQNGVHCASPRLA